MCDEIDGEKLNLSQERSKSEMANAEFPFLTDENTVKYISNSTVLFLMRCLPGSGKSTIVAMLQEKYKESAVCSADRFFTQGDGTYSWSREKLSAAHEQCHTKAIEACEAKTPVVIIDNTNIKRWEMKFYVELASQHCYTVVVVTPKTPWCLDVEELAKRNTHRVPVEALQEKKRAFVHEYICPLYWGWFLNERATDLALGLADKYFQLVVEHCTEFADFFRNTTGRYMYNLYFIILVL